jgi:hypothetical protein
MCIYNKSNIFPLAFCFLLLQGNYSARPAKIMLEACF